MKSKEGHCEDCGSYGEVFEKRYGNYELILCEKCEGTGNAGKQREERESDNDNGNSSVRIERSYLSPSWLAHAYPHVENC